MLPSISCTWLIVLLLLTSLRVGWSHDFEPAIVIPINQTNNVFVRVDVHGSAIDLIIGNSSKLEKHRDQSRAVEALIVNEELLFSMENPQLVFLNREGNELAEHELKNASLSFPLKVRLHLVKGKSKQPLLFQMLEQQLATEQQHVLQQQRVGYGRRRRRSRRRRRRWWKKAWKSVKRVAKKVVKTVKKVAKKVVKTVKKVVRKVKKVVKKVVRKVKKIVKKVVKKVKKVVKKIAKIAKKVVKKAIELGKKALNGVIGCVGKRATGCFMNPVSCISAVKGAAGCLKKEAKEVKEAVTATAIEIKDQAQRTYRSVKHEVVKQGRMVTHEVSNGVDATIAKSNIDARGAVNKLVDKSLEAIQSVDSQLARNLTNNLDVDLVRRLVAKSVTSVEKEALGQTAKMVANTGEKLGELKGRTEYQVKQENAAVVKKVEAGNKAIKATADADLKATMIEKGSLLKMSKWKGAVDKHANPTMAIVDQAGLIVPDNQVESTDKRNKMMRHSVSWKGSFERIQIHTPLTFDSNG